MSNNEKDTVMFLIKKFLPKSLLTRSLIIIVMPLLLLHLILGHIFLDRHTGTILESISENIAGDIALSIDWINEGKDIEQIQEKLEKYVGIAMLVLPKENFVEQKKEEKKWLHEYLDDALQKVIKNPYAIRMRNDHIYIHALSDVGVIEYKMSRKKLFSRTIPLVFIWTSISAAIFFLIASVFMKNQIRPIKRLATAAERFGRGGKHEKFIPEGALEVKQAGIAFLMMQERITHLLTDRMQMLAGVSHDLRTPLTRLKLQASLLENVEQKESFTQDILQMQNMLESYLDYARGVLSETPQDVDIIPIMRDILSTFHNDQFLIKFITIEKKNISLKVATFNRLLTNLVINSSMHATKLDVTVKESGNYLEIILDDNGPGIPEGERKNVFKPFYTLNQSRTEAGNNVGLGLSIVKDGVRSHGGHVVLKDSPYNGLRVVISLPLKKNFIL